MCKHEWKIISEQILPSAWEQLMASRAARHNESELPAWVFNKKLVIILECSKCGKLDKTVESNPL